MGGDFTLRNARRMNLPPVAVQRGDGFSGASPMRADTVRECGQIWNRIGGPSIVFSDSGELPLYRYVAVWDNCNFAFCNVWKGSR